jgi:hypothetical protein
MDKFRAWFMKVCVFKKNRNDNDTTACIILLIWSMNVIVIGDNTYMSNISGRNSSCLKVANEVSLPMKLLHSNSIYILKFELSFN